MDTSKEYIKMCEKAEEIHKRWCPNVGDFVYRGKEYLKIKDACCVVTDILDSRIEKCTWLPRQDQLQDIVFEDKIFDWQSWVDLFEQFRVSPIKTEEEACSSMEQLWLAFVMKEKYNKAWSGEEWVK